MDFPKSKQFADSRREAIAKGTWSDFETIILYEIISTCSPDNIDEIRKLYSDVLDYSTDSYCVLPLPSNVVFTSKTGTEITYEQCKNLDNKH